MNKTDEAMQKIAIDRLCNLLRTQLNYIAKDDALTRDQKIIEREHYLRYH